MHERSEGLSGKKKRIVRDNMKKISGIFIGIIVILGISVLEYAQAFPEAPYFISAPLPMASIDVDGIYIVGVPADGSGVWIHSSGKTTAPNDDPQDAWKKVTDAPVGTKITEVKIHGRRIVWLDSSLHLRYYDLGEDYLFETADDKGIQQIPTEPLNSFPLPDGGTASYQMTQEMDFAYDYLAVTVQDMTSRKKDLDVLLYDFTYEQWIPLAVKKGANGLIVDEARPRIGRNSVVFIREEETIDPLLGWQLIKEAYEYLFKTGIEQLISNNNDDYDVTEVAEDVAVEKERIGIGYIDQSSDFLSYRLKVLYNYSWLD